METILRDARYAARRLRRTPGFTLVALLSLALGIGANTAAFSLVNAILLRPPPVAQPEELVEIHLTGPEFPFMPLSYPDYEELAAATEEVFSGIAASQLTLVPHTRDDQVETIPGELVNGDYFGTLGIRPEIGRLLGPEDHVSPGAHPVVVLGHGYWRSAFGADPGVVGREVRLAGNAYTVVGVAPEDYSGTIRGIAPSVYLPLMMIDRLSPSATSQLEARDDHGTFVTARLADGATLPQARAAVSAFVQHQKQQYPDSWPGPVQPVLTPVSEIYVSPAFDSIIASAAALLLAVVGLVLLIACANLASFLLAQARERRREIAIRLALGAHRGVLMRQLLTESLLLGVLGGAGGVLLARVLLAALQRADLPLPIPITLDLSPDPTVLGFALLVSLAAGVLFGLAPALQATRPDVVEDIKNENAGGGPPRRVTLRGALVVGQVAISLLLLVITGLFLRSLRERQAVDPGFGYSPAAIMTFALPSDRYPPEEARAFVQQLEERVSALPAVEATGSISNLHLNPMSTSTIGINVDGHTPPEGRQDFAVDYAAADSGFFSAAELAIVRGRNFQPTDVQGAPQVAIVNEAFAERFWPGDDPVGRTFRRDTARVTVVGVARTAKIRTLAEEPRPFVYLPYSQDGRGFMWLTARTRGSAERALVDVIRTAREMDPDLMILQTRTMERHLGAMLLPARLGAVVFTAFAGLALTLAVIGIYGVVSYSLTRRSREIGIRLSLGAAPSDVVRLLMGSGTRLAAAGVGIGLLLSAAAARLLEGFLFGVETLDPVTFAAVPALLLAVALLAAYLPARRATRVDPAVVLKAE